MPASAAFPPIARANATPRQVFTSEFVQFVGSDSIDPDDGPQPLTFLWDFDDGTSSTAVDPTHAFSDARAHVVTLTVGDGADATIATVVVHVLSPVAPVPPRSSAPLALSDDGARLWIANPDSGTVTLADVSGTPFKVAEIPVCAMPRTVALHEGWLLVACQGDDALAQVDIASRVVVAKIPAGHGPYGVVVAPNDGRVLVSSQDDGELRIYSKELVEEARLTLGDTPRAIAVDGAGRRAFITHFISRGETGRVAVVDLATLTIASEVALVDDPGPDTPDSSRGVPNVLSAIALDPAQRLLWAGGLKSNTAAGLYRDGVAIASENWVRGVAVPIDVGLGRERLIRRIDTNDADSVSAIAFSVEGRYAYFTHQGAGTLSAYDLSLATLYDPGAASTVPFATRVDVGDAPQGVVRSPDGQRLYVTNFLSRDISIVDVSDPAVPSITATLRVTSESLPAEVALGKLHFYRSREPVYSHSNYIACASCHPDGGMSDGRVWDFTQKGEGLRNTKDLRGVAGMGDGPVHWSANFDEIQDFELDIVNTFGGTGLARDGELPHPSLGTPNAGRSPDLDALAAYVGSLATPPRSPFRGPAGELTTAARHGRDLFFSSGTGCVVCHAPPRYTVSGADTSFALYDVGTLSEASGQRLGQSLTGIDVPSLVGVFASAPYFHDGSAATLRDVFRGRAGAGEHDVALSDSELADLEEFLLSLDGHDDTPRSGVEPGAGCSCRGVDGSVWTMFGLLMATMLRRRRAQRRIYG